MKLLFNEIEDSLRNRTTKHEDFLSTMNKVNPWVEWVASIAPHRPSGQSKRL